mmetsp:Transcript_22761/g.34676  ORF Transcript_22761/g.34676 Transcript_22761/m.34676 type:complete len:128 (+) Transcript_22761:83-466(+)
MLFFTISSGFSLGKNSSLFKQTEKINPSFLLKINKKKAQRSPISLKASGNGKEDNTKTEKEEENVNSIFSFIKEVAEETRMVEWPSLERLFKQFVIVVISLVISAFIIYSVDGFFASLSQFLFEGKS